jgi:hypothetical protein
MVEEKIAIPAGMLDRKYEYGCISYKYHFFSLFNEPHKTSDRNVLVLVSWTHCHIGPGHMQCSLPNSELQRKANKKLQDLNHLKVFMYVRDYSC